MTLLTAAWLPYALGLLTVLLWLAGTFLDHHTTRQATPTRHSTLTPTATVAAGVQTTTDPGTTSRVFSLRLALSLTLATTAQPHLAQEPTR